MMSDLIEARDVLNGFIVDFVTPIQVLHFYENGEMPKVSDTFRVGIYRFCLQTIILNCSKYSEFCRDYGKICHSYAPELTELRNRFKDDLEKRGVNEFRTNFIAHNKASSKVKALNVEQVDSFINKIAGSDALPFLNWIYPVSSTKGNPDSYLVGVIVMIRDKLNESIEVNP
jgi:hypothetical protein